MNPGDKRISPWAAGIHVAGYSRTGTTLLTECLQNHPSVLRVIGENNLLRFMPRIRKRFQLDGEAQARRRYAQFLVDSLKGGAARALGVLNDGRTYKDRFWDFDSESDVVEQVQKGCSRLTDHRVFLYAALDIIARKSGKTAWAGKVHPAYIEKTLSCTDNQFVIGMIRDPRSVLASRRLQARKAGDPWSLLLMAFRYRSCLRHLSKAKRSHPENVQLVKYEDLVHSPEDVLKRLFASLPLRYHPSVLRVSGNNSSYERASTGIVSTSVERWKKELSKAEVCLVQFIFRQEIIAWYNEHEKVSFSARVPGVAALAAAQAVGAAFRYMLGEILLRLGIPKRRRVIEDEQRACKPSR